MDKIQLAWAAGLIEGEGCFSSSNSYVRIKVQMADRDVVERLAELFEASVCGPYSQKRPGKEHYKDQWSTTIIGKRAVGWCLTIYPFMGIRRRAKIQEVITNWLAMPRGRPQESP